MVSRDHAALAIPGRNFGALGPKTDLELEIYYLQSAYSYCFRTLDNIELIDAGCVVCGAGYVTVRQCVSPVDSSCFSYHATGARAQQLACGVIVVINGGSTQN